MKMFVISDNTDTLTGLRMAGVEGVIARDESEVKRRLDEVLAMDDVGILLINGTLAKLAGPTVDRIKASRSTPLLLEIPDRHGNGRDENAISEFIRSAVGVNI